MKDTGIQLPINRDGKEVLVELKDLTEEEMIASVEAMSERGRGLLLYICLGYAVASKAKIGELEAEAHHLTEENTRIRAALAVSKDPCIYCQLPAAEMGKCKHGFPGCSRMDDITGCPEFGASMQLHDANAEIERLKQLIPKP